MASGRPDLWWAAKALAAAAFCLAGAVAGMGLYFGNLAYIRASAAAPPSVTGLSPASGSTAGGTVVTITGTGLAGATGVRFGAAPAAITADAATQITVTSPPGTGTVIITVTTPAGTAQVTAADRYTYISGLSTPSGS